MSSAGKFLSRIFASNDIWYLQHWALEALKYGRMERGGKNLQDFSWKLKCVLKGFCRICTSPKSLFPVTSQGCSWYNSLRFLKLKYLRARWDRNAVELALVGGSSFPNLPNGFSFGVPTPLQPHTPISVAQLVPKRRKDAWSPNPLRCSGFFPVNSKLGGKFPSGKWKWKCIFSSHYWDISCTSFYYFIKISGFVSISMSCPQCSTGAFTDTSLRNHPSHGAHKPSRMVITMGNKLTAILTSNCN